MVPVGSNDQKGRSLCENPTRAREIFCAGYQDCWPYVRTFSEAIPGLLLLFHTLEIDVVDLDFRSRRTIDPEMMGPPRIPSSAVQST